MRRIRSFWKLRHRGRGLQKIMSKGIPSSKSEKLFLDMIGSTFGVKIFRQFKLHHRFFDGQFEMHLFEIDGEKWHSKSDQILRDKLKDNIARRNGFILHRIKLNSVREIPNVFEENRQLLTEIFDGKKSQNSTTA